MPPTPHRQAVFGTVLLACLSFSGCEQTGDADSRADGSRSSQQATAEATSIDGYWDVEFALDGSDDSEIMTLKLVERDGQLTVQTCNVDYESRADEYVAVGADCKDDWPGTRDGSSFSLTIGTQDDPERVAITGQIEGERRLSGDLYYEGCGCTVSFEAEPLDVLEGGE